MGQTVHLLNSLLDAIIRLEGEALVMHVGEKPYVVTTPSSLHAFRGPLAWGQVELSTRVLTSEAVLGMLGQILPLDQRQELEDFGAIEYEVPRDDPGGDLFTIIAARGGADVWLEVRRRHPEPEVEAALEEEVEAARQAAALPEQVPSAAAGVEAPAEVPPELVEAEPQVPLAQAQHPEYEQEDERELAPEPVVQLAERIPLAAAEEEETYELRAEEAEPVEEIALTEEGEAIEEPPTEAAQAEFFEISLEDVAGTTGAEEPIEVVHEIEPELPTIEDEDVEALLAATAAELLEQTGEVEPRAEEPVAVEPVVPEPVVSEPVAAEPVVSEPVVSEPVVREPVVPEPVVSEPVVSEPVVPEPVVPEPVVPEPVVSEPVVSEPVVPEPVVPEPVVPEPVVSEPVVSEPVVSEPVVERTAVVLPLSRPQVRPEAVQPPAQAPAALIAPLEHMLRVAAARGASTVYVVAGSKPMIRVDGEISALDAEAAFAASDVDRVVMELAPARGRDGNQPVEWMSDVPEVGRVRCVTFSDHRGPGIIFRMIPPRAISAEQLGLPSEVQALCAQPDGLVLVTGPRASGKSTLLSAFVDLINRTRSDHVITIESQIAFVHESRRSFVSQREVRGDSEAAVAALRSAFREDPDVLVIEDLRTPEIVTAALEAAESGRLVFGSLRASSTSAAIERLVELFPAERRAQVQGSLATSLRGAVSQLLLRKVKGGRIAAREVLLNTPAVAGLVTEGKLFQLPVALESGRKQGMVPLNDSLASLARDGTVHVAEAYRKALDREGLLALFTRDGMDTSFAERLA